MKPRNAIGDTKLWSNGILSDFLVETGVKNVLMFATKSQRHRENGPQNRERLKNLDCVKSTENPASYFFTYVKLTFYESSISVGVVAHF